MIPCNRRQRLPKKTMTLFGCVVPLIKQVKHSCAACPLTWQRTVLSYRYWFAHTLLEVVRPRTKCLTLQVGHVCVFGLYSFFTTWGQMSQQQMQSPKTEFCFVSPRAVSPSAGFCLLLNQTERHFAVICPKDVYDLFVCDIEDDLKHGKWHRAFFVFCFFGGFFFEELRLVLILHMLWVCHFC